MFRGGLKFIWGAFKIAHIKFFPTKS